MIRAIRSVLSDARYGIRKWTFVRNNQSKAKAKDDASSKLSTQKRIRADEPVFVAAHAASGYCRAALVSSKGKVLDLVVMPCTMYEKGIFHEMSSDNIWKTLVNCVKKVTDIIEHADIQGIGFIAIPALVCLDTQGNPITASTSRDPNINVIVNYDNRSTLEAEKINKTRHELLQYLGERVLPELQESKLLWLKNNLKEDCWDKSGHFLDLTDYLTFKATGSFTRSSSCLLSHWTYEVTVNGKEGWNAQYLKEIELPEVTENNFKIIGSEVQRPGIAVPNGLLEDVAREMGLRPNLPVAVGMSDDLAGCLGLVGCNVQNVTNDITNRLCVVLDTRSAAHFILSHSPHFVKGVKGPFRDSVLPNMWLNHAGQTTAESVLEYIIDTHPATPEIRKQIGRMHIHKYLNKILKIKASKHNSKSRSFLTKYLHILPDFDGNISPVGDPWIRGMISGLSLISNQDSLALLYLATMQSLAYSTRHIIGSLTQHGHDVKSILIGGYLGKNSVFATLHRDVCQLPTVTPDEPKSKILGAAILAGVASNYFRNFNHAIQEMCGRGEVILPERDREIIGYHERKYQVFLKMYDHQMEYRRIMSGGNEEAKRAKTNK